MTAHLVLVGGGHAHLAVLRSFVRDRWPTIRSTLISPDRWQVYSGMVPGYLRGRFERHEIVMDLERICAASGTEWVPATVRSIDAEDGTLQLDSRRGVRFDVASLDIGSIPAGIDLPGVREHAWPLRPLSRVTALRDRLDALARNRYGAPVVVVGAGAAGVETTFAVHRRMVDAGGRPHVTILDAEDRLVRGYPDRARSLVGTRLEALGIEVRTGTRVRGVDRNAVVLESGEELESALTIWVTGASPPPLLQRTDLRRSERGYMEVDRTLRAGSVAGERVSAEASEVVVFGAGDCVDLLDRRLPRAGVYAVRQGDVLAGNLRAFLAGEELERYDPQTKFLSLLDTADGRAVFSRDPFVFRGRWARVLKDWIDTRFIRRYQSLELRDGAVPRAVP